MNSLKDTIVFEKPYNFKFKRPEKFRHDFRNVFVDKIQHIDKYEEDVFYKDDKVVVIYDNFPKAHYHLLVLPRDVTILDMNHLTRDHIPLVKYMEYVGEQIIKYLKQTIKEKVEFKTGFHAIPSLKVLHLHVISQDFVSKALKKNEHWNSFTTSFFISPDFVINQLEERGKVEIDTQEFANIKKSNVLTCIRTGQTFKNIGALKCHLQKLYDKDQQ
jgi:aprataxin